MTDLIDTTEMYLRIILELEEEGQVPKRARIVERLDQSGPTVSETVARMQKNGLLELGDNKQIELTPTGREQATAVLRKHRIAECFLLDVLKLDWEDLHEEACKWEHVISDQVEQKLLAQLENKSHSPFGNPIPGLAKFGLTESTSQQAVVALSDIPRAIASQNVLKLARIGENLQSDIELMRRFKIAKFVPGAEFKLEFILERVVVSVSETDEILDLASFQAEQLFIFE